MLGKSQPLIGYHVGAETGQLSTKQDSLAAAGTFFMGSLKAK